MQKSPTNFELNVANNIQDIEDNLKNLKVQPWCVKSYIYAFLQPSMRVVDCLWYAMFFDDIKNNCIVDLEQHCTQFKEEYYGE